MSLTIQGYVETASYTGVEVKFHVGDTEFHGDVDSLGNYSIYIEVNESKIDNFISAEAIFPGISQVKYFSNLGSMEKLLQRAGEDQVLVHSEMNEVNITSISTALSAHLKGRNKGEIKSDSELIFSLKQLDASIVFDVATSIKLFADNKNIMEDVGLFLPDGFNHVYELAESESAISLFVYNTKKRLPDLFQEMQSDMIRNGNLVGYTSNVNLPIADTYYLPFLRMRLVLHPDGTGEVNGEVDHANFTWSQIDEGIIFEGADLIRYVSAFDSHYVENHILINSLVWLMDGDVISSIILNVDEYDISPDEKDTDLDLKSEIYAETAIRSSRTIKISESLKLEQEYSFPIPAMAGEIVNPVVEVSPWFSVNVLDMSFTGEFGIGGTVNISIPGIEGDGKRVNTTVSGLWRLEDDKKIVVDASTGSKFTYIFLDYIYNEKKLTFVLEESERGQIIDFDTVLTQNLDSWQENSVEGIYQFRQHFTQPLVHSWFEINSNGTVNRISTFDSNFDGKLEAEEFDIYKGLWKFSGDGNLLIRVYQKIQGGSCIPNEWDTQFNTECLLVNEREWDLSHISKEQQLFWMRKELKFFVSGKRQELPGLSDLTSDIFSSGHIYNSFMYKVSERPVIFPSIK
ncbi:hypothetical protein GL2_15170 [Microbulbifer sp. GL-2]|nr:hypothetical protein GL2_15170 [Microbulbifer sp. GL-2]